MRRRNELTADEYAREMDRLRQEMAVQQLTLHEDEIDIAELESMLEQASILLKNIKPLYKAYGTEHKRRLIQLIYPHGIKWADGVLQTNKKSELFKIFEDSGRKALPEVSPLGVEPRT